MISIMPSLPISNTPTSLVEPKRFFTPLQKAILVEAVAFEVEHHVHHMLEHARPRDSAFLRDVAHQEHGNIAQLGEAHQARGALAHLADRPGGGCHLRHEHCLYRVDNHQAGLQSVYLHQYRLEVGLGEEQQPLRIEIQARCAQLYLLRAFLARHVKDGFVAP